MIMQDTPHDDAADQDAQLAISFLVALETALARKRDTPAADREESEALFFDSLEAPSEEEECELLIQAVELDPANVAALLSMRDFLALNLDQEIDALRKITALGERRLGKKGFKEYAGHFWDSIETRPYLLARAQLALTLRDAGKFEEAITEWEAMLRLNPKDNQGLRYELLATYLARQRLDGVAKLFSDFNEFEKNTVFAWGHALERFLAGDESGAKEALGVARAQNGFTEAYLLGHRKLSKHLPEAYAPGSKEESEWFAEVLLASWEPHPAAIKWLAAQPKPRSR